MCKVTKVCDGSCLIYPKLKIATLLSGIAEILAKTASLHGLHCFWMFQNIVIAISGELEMVKHRVCEKVDARKCEGLKSSASVRSSSDSSEMLV